MCAGVRLYLQHKIESSFTLLELRGMCDRMNHPPHSLLGVNAGVDILITSFVASGEGGLRDVLNLRLVCRTTQLWVDTLPKPTADVVFSKSQVTVGFHDPDISEFLSSPPPFGVTTLVLREEQRPIEDSNKATEFCEFWRSKLETLEIKLRTRYDVYCHPSKHPILNLMESPNLTRLHLDVPFFNLFQNSVLPSCFQNVSELHLSFHKVGDLHRSQIFSQLQSNTNLKVFHADLSSEKVFLEFSKLINHKKEDTEVYICFGWLHGCKWVSDEDRYVFRPLFESIISSKSKIRLVNVFNLGDLYELMNEFIPRNKCHHLLTKIESVNKWTPSDETMSLLENLPVLRKVTCVKMDSSSVNYDQLAFPPSVEELCFDGTFPPCGSLPQSLSLISLRLQEIDINSLLSSLSLLRDRCPKLVTLELNISSRRSADEKVVTNIEASSGFSNLTNLTLKGGPRWVHIEETRAAFLKLFDFRSLKLTHLKINMGFVDNPSNIGTPFVDEKILKHILEGPSAKSLTQLKIWSRFITREARPLLRNLESSVAENFRMQNERMARTRWV